MPQNTPLTKSPFPSLSDAPNIETAVGPGLHELEKYAIPRFTSRSQRNQAFQNITRQHGMLTYITNLGPMGYEIWDGSNWVELGEYLQLRKRVSILDEQITRSATGLGNTPIQIPVTAGRWLVEVYVVYSTTNQEATNIALDFTFPGTNSRMHSGALGRGINALGNNTSGTQVNTQHSATRASGSSDHELGGPRGPGDGPEGGGITNSTFGHISGMLDIAGSNTSGNLRLQYARSGAAGTVALWRGTRMIVQRVS